MTDELFPDDSSSDCSEFAESDKNIPVMVKKSEMETSGPVMRKDLITPKLVAALDRCQLSIRNSVYILEATLEALGLNVDEYPISKSSIQRIRTEKRKERAEAIKVDFQNDVPVVVTVHWDGKLLPALDARKSKEELLSILITHGNKEQLLAVPKLREINEEAASQQQPRKRSNSLPIPKIEVSLYQSTDLKKSAEDSNKDLIEVPEPKDVSLLAECPYSSQTKSEESLHKRTASEKSKRRMKIADLKTFVETKLLSKSEKALEKIGQEEPKPLGQMSQECHRSLDTGDDNLSKPPSPIAKIFEPPSNLVKGKSMPSLRSVEESHWECRRTSRLTHSQPMANPIITVTEHTPTPSPDYLKRETFTQGSMDSQLDAASLTGSKLSGWQERKSSLTRSQTDSNITYAGEEIQEAPGSGRYITKDGDIDLQVVLQAVHRTAMRESTSCTLRVLEVILNLVELLLDMNILKQCLRDEALANIFTSKQDIKYPGASKVSPGSTGDSPHGSDGEQPEKFISPHRLMMNIIVRASGKMLKNYLRDYVKYQSMNDILDFFHAYLGYCVDPSSLLSPLSKNDVEIPEFCYDQLSSCYYCKWDQRLQDTTRSAGVGRTRGVEGQIVSCAFKQMVTRFIEVGKEIKMPENLATYCEIRQMMTYVKEAHGSVFRRVALSALIDTADRPSKKEPATQTTRVIRHMHHSEIDDPPDATTDSQSFSVDDKGTRKQLFKKRSTSSTCASLRKFEEETPCFDTQTQRKSVRYWTGSITVYEVEKIQIWRYRKGDSSSTDDQDMQDNGESFTDTASFVRKPSVYYQKPSKSNVIKKAKRRMEGKFNRKNSLDQGETSRESEFVVLKERKLVSTTLVYEGVSRLSFLLETCPPGSVPDAHLLASTLDLPHSTVVARAALFLECAFFVHCCNKGQWPSWMKMSFPVFRPSGPLPHRGNNPGMRRSHILQSTAGKMFHQWAEAIGQRLEEMMKEDKNLQPQIATLVSDEQKQKELLIQDEEEDFLDEAFLRETYQTLPKSSRMVGKDRPPPWEKLYSKEANRRWSMALSSMGHSQTSAQSLQSIAGGDPGQAERKISFVLHEPDNESEGSSNTTVTMQPNQGEETKRVTHQHRPHLLRRGTAAQTGGSFKRRSLKLRRGRIPESVKRTDSIQSKRKVSSLSDRSDASEPGGAGEMSEEESTGVPSDEQPPESPSDSNDTDDTSRNMPWLKVSNSLYYYCPHQGFCHPFCYRRVMRGCRRLIKAVRKVYGEQFGVIEDRLSMDYVMKKKNKKDKNQSRKVSDQTGSTVSPIRRKDSVGRKDKIDKTLDSSLPGKNASKESSRDVLDPDGSDTKGKGNEEKTKCDPPPILRYIHAYVLWKMRYQAWPRMEENAQMLFKVPPPGIEFTLPSPKIGIESLEVVDAPWVPSVKTKVEEVTINQERHRSLVTATKTRKKQQTELIKMALQAQDDKKREEREKFLITTIPITIQAAHEPSLHHTNEEHEEVDEEQADGPSRNTTTHHLHSAHSLFPSCLCSAVVQIINLLDDAAVSPDGNAVYEVAYQVIWTCLVEDSALFLRYILERLTREKQDLMIKILRHLIRFIPKLPQQAAFALYNYIIGYVMFYVVHSVHGIMFKDLKQILRKEQCDASILLTANVPSAKKIIVHGPQDPDAGGIPSQFPVQEDTQFYQILRESLDFFGIDENRQREYFLVDYKTPDEVIDISYTPPKKRAKELHFSVSEKQIILNIYKHEMQQRNDLSVEEIVCKVAMISGVSRSSVYRIIREYKSNHLLADPKKYPPRKKINNSIDDFESGAIRRIVHNFFFRNEFLTVDKVLKVVNDDKDLPSFRRSTFYKLLKEMGFQYKKRGRDSLLLEKEEIVIWRREYLRKIKKFRAENRNIYFLDETWANAGHTQQKVWMDSYVKSSRQAFMDGLSNGLKNPSGKGKRLIICHIGSVDGFVPDALWAFQSKKTGDYHEEMDGASFENWFSNTLSKIEENAVIVLDNAAYHTRKIEKIPTMLSKEWYSSTKN
nr:unnamed protein product [Callosobruchus chinensis]